MASEYSSREFTWVEYALSLSFHLKTMFWVTMERRLNLRDQKYCKVIEVNNDV